MKYRYKYVYKGVDCIAVKTAVEGQQTQTIVDWDEVRSYLDCRYVTSVEAAWRLLDFPLSDRSHAVMILPVHLVGGQSILFEETQTEEELEEVLGRKSKLIAYFELNCVDPEAWNYFEIPEKYTWDGKHTRWCKRKQI